MAHSGGTPSEAERAAALSTPVDKTGEIQIPVGGLFGGESSSGPQTQSTQSKTPEMGISSSSQVGPQMQSATKTAEMQIPFQTSFVQAGPQTQSASSGQFDKMLETMNNMAAAMASQAQGMAASAPSVGLSSLRSVTVDTKGILTVEDYWGEKDKFLSW